MQAKTVIYSHPVKCFIDTSNLSIEPVTGGHQHCLGCSFWQAQSRGIPVTRVREEKEAGFAEAQQRAIRHWMVLVSSCRTENEWVSSKQLFTFVQAIPHPCFSWTKTVQHKSVFDRAVVDTVRSLFSLLEKLMRISCSNLCQYIPRLLFSS